MKNRTIDTKARILEATWHLMEKHQGKGVSMSKIAKEAGISRQALYLHFDSRIKLITATVQYVDEVKGLNDRLKGFQEATSGVELLEVCVDIWGNYIPEIYGIAKAMLNTRETDEATDIAWNSCMSGLRSVCKQTIDTLIIENNLASKWTNEEATEMFFTILSIHNWEQLTIECKWTNEQYIERIKILLKRTFIN
ncbi:MAG: TetR/AcrR family transcriptional regulator [Endozoicomonadaceae bacterium]|nr:TetR/AcrR family transcriptional regulator [Endozoicomonadaceae bacterium]